MIYVRSDTVRSDIGQGVSAKEIIEGPGRELGVLEADFVSAKIVKGSLQNLHFLVKYDRKLSTFSLPKY